MLIKTSKGLTPQQITQLFEKLGSDMVVAHNPKLGGVVVFPFGPVEKGVIPKEFLNAQKVAGDILGKKGKVQWGASLYDVDRFFMPQEDYIKFGGGTMPQSQADLLKKLQGTERSIFSGGGGGLQPWSTSKLAPVNVEGVGLKGEYVPVNYATGERGPRFSPSKSPGAAHSYDRAHEEAMKMLDSWHRTLPSYVR